MKEGRPKRGSPARSQHVVVWGANWVGNLGDYAIADGTIRMVRHSIPEARISIFHHGFTGVDARRHAAFTSEYGHDVDFVDALPFVFYGRVRAGLSNVVHSAPLAGRFMLAKARFKLRRMMTATMARVRSASLLLMSGGGHWGWDGLTANLLAQVDAFHAQDRPVWLLPHSMPSGFADRIGSSRARRILSKCSGVLLRDYESLAAAGRLGLPSATFCADCAFAVNPPRPGRSGADTRRYLMIALRSTPGRLAGASDAEFIRVVAAARTSGLTPMLLTTCEKDDALLLDRLKEVLPEVMQARPTTFDEAIRLMGDAELVLTDRFHCVVFAMLAGSVVIPVTTPEKVRGMAQTVPLPLAADSEAAVEVDSFREALRRSSAMRATQDAFVLNARKQLEGQFEEIAASIRKPWNAHSV